MSFDEEFKYIVAMKSVEGETVPLRNKVLLSNDVEVRKSYPNIFPKSFEKIICNVPQFFKIFLAGVAKQFGFGDEGDSEEDVNRLC